MAGDSVFVAAGTQGLLIYRLADLAPDAVPVGAFDTSGEARRVAISGSLAYVADSGGGLQILDVSNPMHPALRGSLRLADNVMDVAISGHYAFVAGWYAAGFAIVDVINPAIPVLVASRATAGYAVAIALDSNRAYVGVAGDGSEAKVIIFNVSNPAAPATLATMGVPDGPVWDLAVRDGLAYLAAGPAGLRILDVSTPSSPVWRGAWNTPDWAVGIEIAEDLAYVASGFESGLEVVNVADADHPLGIAHHGSREAWSVALAGSRLLVTDIVEGLKVFDVSSPASPGVLATIDSPANLGGGAVSGHHAWFATGEPSGLQGFDLTNRFAPVPAGSVALPGAAWVAMYGHYACVTRLYEGGIQLVDVSSPLTPVLRGAADSPGYAYGIAVAGHHAFVAGGGRGLELYVFPVAPRALAVDGFALEETDHGLRQRVIVGITDTAHRRFDPRFSQSLRVANGQILRAAVAMVNQTVRLFRCPVPERLFQRVERQIAAQRTRRTPARDAT